MESSKRRKRRNGNEQKGPTEGARIGRDSKIIRRIKGRERAN